MSSLFNVRIGKSKTVRDFMKRFGVALLQLEAMSSDTTLQAVNKPFAPNMQFFDSLSLHPPSSIDELFQRGN